jgi:hypothetical protein
MRGYQKAGAAVVALGLAASVAACSSSGSSSKKPVGAFKTLSGQSTSVALDPGFVKTLTALKVTPSPFGTAQVSTAGVASFPITGGNATIYKKGAVKPYVQGTIDHQGSGLNLTAGGTKVTLENFVVHPGNNSNLTGDVLVNGMSFAKGADLFTLDGSTLKTPTLSGGVATLTGTTVYLSPTAEKALNTAFKITAIKGKIKVGVATIKATGK